MHQISRRSLLYPFVVAGVFSVLTCQAVFAQTTQPDATMHKIIRLWPGDAPGAKGQADFDVPTLTLFQPPPGMATGAAVIVCPGGGYTHLAPHEGPVIAEWLNTLGITAGVLKYRLGSHGYQYPVEMEDGQRAIRLFRAKASELNIDAKKIGIIGFSAGGHLASTTATHFDDGNAKSDDPIERAGSRPDLAMLIYPVITMGKYAHQGSLKALLGDKPDPALLELLSNEKQITPGTPPCFIVHGADDKTVPIENSLQFAAALRENKVPFELHVFEHGPHGFGLGEKDAALRTWPADAALFLGRHGFLGSHLTTAPTH